MKCESLLSHRRVGQSRSRGLTREPARVSLVRICDATFGANAPGCTFIVRTGFLGWVIQKVLLLADQGMIDDPPWNGIGKCVAQCHVPHLCRCWCGGDVGSSRCTCRGAARSTSSQPIVRDKLLARAWCCTPKPSPHLSFCIACTQGNDLRFSLCEMALIDSPRVTPASMRAQTRCPAGFV